MKFLRNAFLFSFFVLILFSLGSSYACRLDLGRNAHSIILFNDCNEKLYERNFDKQVVDTKTSKDFRFAFVVFQDNSAKIINLFPYNKSYLQDINFVPKRGNWKCSFSAYNNYVVLSCGQNIYAFDLYDERYGQERLCLSDPLIEEVCFVHQFCLVRRFDKSIQLFNLKKDTLVFFSRTNVKYVEFSPDERYMVLNVGRKTEVFDLLDSQGIKKILVASTFTKIVFDKDAKYFVGLSDSGDLSIFDLYQRCRLVSTQRGVRDILFSNISNKLRIIYKRGESEELTGRWSDHSNGTVPFSMNRYHDEINSVSDRRRKKWSISSVEAVESQGIEHQTGRKRKREETSESLAAIRSPKRRKLAAAYLRSE